MTNCPACPYDASNTATNAGPRMTWRHRHRPPSWWARVVMYVQALYR
jgi:hypothetical protein